MKPWDQLTARGRVIRLRDAARQALVCNYVARYERPYLRQHLDRVVEMFSHFLVTGLLQKLA